MAAFQSDGVGLSEGRQSVILRRVAPIMVHTFFSRNANIMTAKNQKFFRALGPIFRAAVCHQIRRESKVSHCGVQVNNDHLAADAAAGHTERAEKLNGSLKRLNRDAIHGVGILFAFDGRRTKCHGRGGRNVLSPHGVDNVELTVGIRLEVFRFHQTWPPRTAAQAQAGVLKIAPQPVRRRGTTIEQNVILGVD
jgi:hypothetical protein